ncbi:MAG: hypothetical protein IE922_09595 [Sphingomonadales bacterium]|nr:hypothetical protein [Sphingomonadales bacterium]
MLNILDIAIAFPERQEQLHDLTDDLSLSRDQLRMFDRFFGFDRFHADPAEPLPALLMQAGDAVLARNPGAAATLSHVAHCHTLLSTGIFGAAECDPLARFRAAGCETFSATMNHCATGVSMLGTFARLLEPGQTGMILIGEKAFHPALRHIENTTLMGEAAVAILVGHQPGPWQVLDTHVTHATPFWKNTGLRGERYLEGFDTAYLPLACNSIERALSAFGRAPGQIRAVMPHNVNLPSWCQLGARTGFAREALHLSTIGRYGHCFGADPFINLIHATETGGLRASDEVLLFSIGLGATAASALLRVS